MAYERVPSADVAMTTSANGKQQPHAARCFPTVDLISRCDVSMSSVPLRVRVSRERDKEREAAQHASSERDELHDAAQQALRARDKLHQAAQRAIWGLVLKLAMAEKVSDNDKPY